MLAGKLFKRSYIRMGGMIQEIRGSSGVRQGEKRVEKGEDREKYNNRKKRKAKIISLERRRNTEKNK